MYLSPCATASSTIFLYALGGTVAKLTNRLFFIVPALVFASMTALHHDFASTTLAVVVDVLVVAVADATAMSAATIAVGMTARIRAPFCPACRDSYTRGRAAASDRFGHASAGEPYRLEQRGQQQVRGRALCRTLFLAWYCDALGERLRSHRLTFVPIRTTLPDL